MASSRTSVPPTTNDLTHSQRLRLMRSTRKLGEVLGTTPMFSLPDPPRRSTTSIQSAPSISLSHSSSILHRSKSKTLPRPLVLSLQSVPASPRHSLSPSTPLSPTRSMNRASYHDLSCDDDPLRIRRKRMAKLARTFGENIPPELVADVPQGRPSRPRSCSVDATTLAATFRVTVMKPDHSADFEPRPPTPPKSSKHLQMRNRSPTLVSRSTSMKTPSSPSVLEKQLVGLRHGHSSSLGLEGLHLEKVESPYTLSAGRKSFESTTSTASSTEYRKQAGWSGEWNRDMPEVMAQLRGLRST